LECGIDPFKITPKAFANLSDPFKITPKAFANLSLGLERSDNPRITTSENRTTLKGVRQLPKPFAGF